MKRFLLLAATIVINVIASAQTKSIVYFDSNKNDLTTTATKCLDSLATFIKDKNGSQITISGYCDNTGIDKFNQILSDFRAETVFNYFRSKNLKANFSFKGYASANPIADNSTENGKAKNRRVEIIIITIAPSPKIETKIPEVTKSEIAEPKKAFSTTSTIADLEVGKTLILENLNFEGGTAILLAEAKPTLDLLIKTMKDNPTLEIEIGGHVCCSNDMPLSIMRAKTVYNYLSKKGIDESRMTYKGYRRNKPIIEDDRQEADAKVNRRVEITVIKK